MFYPMFGWLLAITLLSLPVIFGGESPLTPGEINKATAKWENKEAIFWEIPEAGDTLAGYTYWLYSGTKIAWQEAPAGGSKALHCQGDSVTPGVRFSLPFVGLEKGLVRLSTAAIVAQIPEILKGHVVVTAENKEGKIVQATATQNGGVLDELFFYGGKLGIAWDNATPTLKLWAPTARSVKLHLFAAATAGQAEQTYDLALTAPGVWAVVGKPDWTGKFYLYEVEVFVLATGQVEHNLVTDPYSVSLAANSTKSQIIALDEKSLQPDGWDKLAKPPLESFSDIVIYELHLRDFSMDDASVPELYRGTYLAFTIPHSRGMQHLGDLARSGLTHIHLLPVFDIATIEEVRDKQQLPTIPTDAPANSPLQQEAVGKVKDADGYNWGYDPYHYNTPEGSYATDPNGPIRTVEFRKMVQSLSRIGLRVVMDVVYNHTHACCQGQKSVLDRIVPGYYYRLDKNGKVYNTSCCPDTASERAMMEKLIVDSLVLWARDYKVDGFRFDLMGHHTKGNMKKIRAALDGLTLEKDGVDGQKIYLYGEGWRFGSLYENMPDEACHQVNAFGLGIGTFNDRIRDCLRGGNFEHATRADQGFLTGLYYDYNHDPACQETPPELARQKTILLNYMDNIRVALAGNLRDFPIIDCQGNLVKGGDIVYRGTKGAGYTASPQECINYVSVHDNYCLWDQIAAKAPFHTKGRMPATATAQERLRIQMLGMAMVALGQGIPLFDAGMDMLRSKSGDGDSYNSGDWFNRLDFTYQSNHWGVGLPPAWKNEQEWPFWKPRLAERALKPSPAQIQAGVRYFQALLRIRQSTRLLRLRSALEIITRVRFLDTDAGPDQTPGLIVMAISDKLPRHAKLDTQRQWLICLFNATRKPITFTHTSLKNKHLKLHPELTTEIDPAIEDASHDPKAGTIRIPGRCSLVYYEPR